MILTKLDAGLQQVQQRQQQKMEIQLECQNKEIEKLNINNPRRIDDPHTAIQYFVQQLVEQSEKINKVNKFQDKLIVQGSENISTIIQKDHEEFSQEKQELEKTLYHRAQYF